MRRTLLALSLTLAFALSAVAQMGYFHVQEQNGIWWFIGPNGHRRLSLGVDSIRPSARDTAGNDPYGNTVRRLYPDLNAWALHSLARLRMWRFNTIGAWSDPVLFQHEVPYTIILNIAARAGANWKTGQTFDVWSPRFAQVAQDAANRQCIPRVNDHWLLGYFSDNELRWGPDWRGKDTLLSLYLKMPPSSPGRQKALAFLRDRYRDSTRRLRAAWGVRVRDFDRLATGGRTAQYRADADQFAGMVSARYFQVCADAIHQADPNHLYLGARFAGHPSDAVLRGARSADVVSVNIYSSDPTQWVKHVFQMTGRPLLITEFAFRAADAGLPNSKGAGVKVPDQSARGQAYTRFVTALLRQPFVVGYHWFEWADEPPLGRALDGENSNYGLVNSAGQPYTAFIKQVQAINSQAKTLHASAPSL